MEKIKCTTCRDIQCKGGLYCLVNMRKAAELANKEQWETMDYAHGYGDGARIHQNAYEDGYKAATSTEYLRCKLHCEQAVQEFRDKLIATIKTLGVVDAGADGYKFVKLSHSEVIEAIEKLPLTTSKDN